MGHTAITDEDLLAQSRQGEVPAFGALVERYESLVWSVCFSNTNNRALSDDVTQETFLAAWSSLRTLRDPSRWRPWICGIARNLSRKAIRGRSRERPLEEAADVPAEETPLDRVLDAETTQVVWRSLERIPERYRTPLVLFYREGLAAKEIGEALSLSEAAVHQRLSRGRRYLADDLSKLVEETLSQNQPRKKRGISAAVMAAILAGAVPDADAAARATGESTMTKTLAALTLAAALGGTAYVATTSQDEVTEAPLAEVAEHVATTRTPTPTKVTTMVTEAARPKTTAPKNAPRNRYASYEVEGVARDWADGRLANQLGKCFDAHTHLGRNYGFTLDFTTNQLSAVRLTDGDAIGPQEDALEACLRERLDDFNLAPTAGATPTLSVKFGEKREKPAFDAAAIESMDLSLMPARGAVNAPITMVVFVGLRCFFCGKLLGTLDQLLDEYDGLVRLVMKPYALRETDVHVTEAAYAALAQNRFWPMHDAMMADQDALTDDALVEFAKRAGLDVKRFAADLETGTFREQVELEREELKGMGVVAVPTVVLAGERIMGAQPIENFRARIDAALEAKR